MLHQDSTSIYLEKKKKRGLMPFSFFQLRADDTDQAWEFHLEIELLCNSISN